MHFQTARIVHFGTASDNVGPIDIPADVCAARRGRDIAHANRQKIANEDVWQRGTAAVGNLKCESDVGARRAEGRIGGFGDFDLRFLGLDISGGIGGDVLAVFWFTRHVHIIGQSLLTDNGAIDMGDYLQRFFAAI